MEKGKCIYCKQYKNLNREHAFPKSLLQKGAPGWTIKKHVCVACNSKLAQLDAVLIKKSPLAFIWYRIQDELDNQTHTPHSSISHKRTFGINPVRQFVPDPLYENRIVLHDIITENGSTSILVDSALCPQIALTQHPEEQSSVEVITANREKFNATDSDENTITNHDEQKEIYCVFGNTYIFPPKATLYFFHRIPEFKSKFMNDFPRTQYDLLIIFPKAGKIRRAAETFYKSLEISTREIIGEEKIPYPKPATRFIQVSTDSKATPDIARAIAKIAFHCFLYHYSKFSGHEPIFDDIRKFICTESSNRFVAQWKNTETENCIYDSTEHLHIICYFVQKDDIGCRIDFFTGLQKSPVSYQVILAGKPENLNPSPSRTEYISFYVHPKSQLKKRILPVKNLGIIWQPSRYEGVLWLPKYLL